MENSAAVPQKMKHRAALTSDSTPECTPVSQRPPRPVHSWQHCSQQPEGGSLGPSVDGGIKKLGADTQQCVVQPSGGFRRAATASPGDSRLSDVLQTQKGGYCMIPHFFFFFEVPELVKN